MMNVLMDDTSLLADGFTISTDKTLLDIDLIYNYLNDESYWAKGIPRVRLERAIENSMCFGIYQHTKLAGFARVISDNATFGYICDVFILSQFRKKGLSKWLMQTIVNHPELQGLRRWSLATADAHELYRQFGFTQLSKPDNWMEIFTPYIKLQ